MFDMIRFEFWDWNKYRQETKIGLNIGKLCQVGKEVDL